MIEKTNVEKDERRSALFPKRVFLEKLGLMDEDVEGIHDVYLDYITTEGKTSFGVVVLLVIQDKPKAGKGVRE